jgi:hypothetical protein
MCYSVTKNLFIKCTKALFNRNGTIYKNTVYSPINSFDSFDGFSLFSGNYAIDGELTSILIDTFINPTNDPATADYHLKNSGVFPVDKGNNLLSDIYLPVTNDYDIQSRPIGSAFDLGYDEAY